MNEYYFILFFICLKYFRIKKFLMRKVRDKKEVKYMFLIFKSLKFKNNFLEMFY